MAEAFLRRRSGLREIVETCGECLKTGNFSTLSHALARRSASRFALLAVEDFAERFFREERGDLVALDTMMITLPMTQRHGLARCNNATAGGGVLWAFNTGARLGESPVRVLAIRPGTWRECAVMGDIVLTPCGPIYLMDRGFYKIALVREWLAEGVRFVIRARESNLVHHMLRVFNEPRSLAGGGELLFDDYVCVGSALYRGGERPRVRLLIVKKGKELFHLMTSELEETPEKIMEMYKKRWEIESFHRLLKETLGLAHLYSFKQAGVEFMLAVVTLLATAAFMTAPERKQTVVATMREQLHRIFKELGISRRWQRNTLVSARGNPKKRRRKR